MCGRVLAVAAALMILNGCADPKYASADQGGGPQKPQASGCQARFPSGECVAIVWEKMPTETEFGAFNLNVFQFNAADGSKAPVDIGRGLAVLLWMPDMGHGSSPVSLSRVDVGAYHVTNVFFTMKGAWEIRVQLKDGNAVRAEAIIPIQID